MRISGAILIIVGILMIVFNTISFKTEKNVIDAGPIQVNKQETKHVHWPAYGGGIIAIIGVALVISGNKK